MAAPGENATCPLCGGAVIAKCGDIVIWHWAHKAGADCDPWSEHETQWHIDWKSLFDKVEVTIEKGGVRRRADIVTPGGLVVELQHSNIAPEEIRAREDFYRDMIWLFDATESRLLHPVYGRRLTLYSKGDYCTFRWKFPRKSIAYARRPVFLDLGEGLMMRLGKIYPDGICGGWGELGTHEQFRQGLIAKKGEPSHD